MLGRREKPTGYTAFVNNILGKEPSKRTLVRESLIFAEGLPQREEQDFDFRGRSFYSRKDTADYRREMIDFHNKQVERIKVLQPRLAHGLLINELAERGLVSPDSHVVSLGSSLGIPETFIAMNMCPKGQVIGVDFAHKLNIEGGRIAKMLGAHNVHFVEGDMGQLPIASGSQDLVIIGGPYDFEKSVYDEAMRAMKEGARLVVMCMGYPQFVKSVKRVTEEVGFTLEDEKRFDIKDYPLIFLLFKKGKTE